MYFSKEDIPSEDEGSGRVRPPSPLREPGKILEDYNQYVYTIPEPEHSMQLSPIESQSTSSTVSLQSQLQYDPGFFDIDKLLQDGVQSFHEEVLGSIIKEMLHLPEPNAPLMSYIPQITMNDETSSSSSLQVSRDEVAYRSSVLIYGELPLGWEMRLTEKGRPYFLNHFNLTTTWDDPRCPLPEGWELLITDNDRSVYLNRTKRRASMTDPRLMDTHQKI